MVCCWRNENPANGSNHEIIGVGRCAMKYRRAVLIQLREIAQNSVTTEMNCAECLLIEPFSRAAVNRHLAPQCYVVVVLNLCNVFIGIKWNATIAKAVFSLSTSMRWLWWSLVRVCLSIVSSRVKSMFSGVSSRVTVDRRVRRFPPLSRLSMKISLNRRWLHRTLTVTSTSFEWFFWCKTSQMGANYCTLTLASYRLTHTMLNSMPMYPNVSKTKIRES